MMLSAKRCLAFFLVAHAGVAAAASPSATALAEAGAIAAAALEKQQIPGLAVVVMKGDEVVLARGYGVEESGRSDAVEPATVFALGSMSKQFVAAAILQLAQEEKLSLDDLAAKHLPEWTRLPRELKIRHLLSHTSGMREEFVQPELAKLFDQPGTTFAEYLDAARHSPSDWPPGSRWSYGNINYLMLTVIVERLTGKPLQQVTEERLFKPLGLDSIRLCASHPESVKGEARGHIRREGKLVPHPPENVALFRGSGGFCGSALDVARWMRALASGKVVSPRSYDEMTTRVRLLDGRQAEYGFAMDLGSHDGVQRNGHGGYGGGFSGQAAYYPEAEVTVVVLTNRFVSPEQIERKIARRLLGQPEPVHRAVPLPAGERQRYVGSYDLGIHGWSAEIKERDDRLWFELAAPPLKVPLIYLGNDEFVSADDPDGYRLTFSNDGRELRLVGMGMMTWYGTRR